MIKCLVFLFCCIMPYAAEAGEILNVQDGFQLVKAVKLGRGNAYSVTADSSLNTGAGITKISKRCSSGCSDCDISTGLCNACETRYAKDSAGQCHRCPSNCASCWMEYGDTLSCETCDSGYELKSTSFTGSGPYYCVKKENICLAGTYVSGSNCVTCPDGTYSTGSNQGSCRPCSDIQVNIGSNQYVNCSTCSSTGSCTYYSCPAGYYWKKSGGCAKCPDGCSACSDSSAGVYCTACSAAYYVSGSNGLTICINSDGSSGCPAGYYLSGSNNCVACSSGTWSSGGTAASCSSCSTIYAGGSNITCTSCTTTGTCTGSNGGSSSSSGSSCNSGGATATSPTNCPQGYGWGGSGCVTSSSQCKVCGQGSSLGGYCNCPAGSPSDGRGGCGGRCSYPYSNYCSSGPQSGKCCRSSSDCYYGNNGNCR